MEKEKKKIRKGIAAIVFLKEKGKTKFLLLKRKMNWNGWEWIKGGSKKGESFVQTLKRELKEEIGIKNNYKLKTTPYSHFFLYQKSFIKDKKGYQGANDKIYLVQLFNSKIEVDKKEHSGHAWFSKKEAMEKITWPDQKKIFQIATRKL